MEEKAKFNYIHIYSNNQSEQKMMKRSNKRRHYAEATFNGCASANKRKCQVVLTILKKCICQCLNSILRKDAYRR